jgi:hypothetical protein
MIVVNGLHVKKQFSIFKTLCLEMRLYIQHQFSSMLFPFASQKIHLRFYSHPLHGIGHALVSLHEKNHEQKINIMRRKYEDNSTFNHGHIAARGTHSASRAL